MIPEHILLERTYFLAKWHWDRIYQDAMESVIFEYHTSYVVRECPQGVERYAFITFSASGVDMSDHRRTSLTALV